MEKILAEMVGNLIIQLAQSQATLQALTAQVDELSRRLALAEGPRLVKNGEPPQNS